MLISDEFIQFKKKCGENKQTQKRFQLLDEKFDDSLMDCQYLANLWRYVSLDPNMNGPFHNYSDGGNPIPETSYFSIY